MQRQQQSSNSFKQKNLLSFISGKQNLNSKSERNSSKISSLNEKLFQQNNYKSDFSNKK